MDKPTPAQLCSRRKRAAAADQTGRQTNTDSHTDEDGETDKQTDRDRDRQKETETEADTQTDRKRDRDRQTDRQTDKQAFFRHEWLCRPLLFSWAEPVFSVFVSSFLSPFLILHLVLPPDKR